MPDAMAEKPGKLLSELQTIGRKGQLRERSLRDYAVGYRHVTLKPDTGERLEEVSRG